MRSRFSAPEASGSASHRIFTSDGLDDSDPRALFSYVARGLDRRDIAYLHVIESALLPEGERIAPALRALFKGPFILAADFTRDSAEAAIAEGRADFIAFGRLYIANPDLVERFRIGAPLNAPDVSTFSSGGDAGYIDYPTLAQQLALGGLIQISTEGSQTISRFLTSSATARLRATIKPEPSLAGL